MFDSVFAEVYNQNHLKFSDQALAYVHYGAVNGVMSLLSLTPPAPEQPSTLTAQATYGHQSASLGSVAARAATLHVIEDIDAATRTGFEFTRPSPMYREFMGNVRSDRDLFELIPVVAGSQLQVDDEARHRVSELVTKAVAATSFSAADTVASQHRPFPYILPADIHAACTRIFRLKWFLCD